MENHQGGLMSRDAKRQKLQRRREREFQEKRLSRAYEQPKSTAPAMRQVSYHVTYDPLPDPAVERIENEIGDETLEELNSQIREEPLRAIPRLEPLIREYPDVPMLQNWLAVAYEVAGDKSKSDEINQQLYERHPNYVFALARECCRLLHEGDVDRVTQILDRRFGLKIMYPHRNVFHITEVMAFSHMIVNYLVRIGEMEPAESLAKTMKKLDPDCAETQSANFAILAHKARGFFSKWMGKNRRNGTRPPNQESPGLSASVI
jgi:hypothetical protein